MSTKRVAALMDRFYGDRVNGTIEFRDLIASRLRPTDRVLDLGCGPGRKEINFTGACAFVAGCDYTDSIRRNNSISGGVRGDAYHLPFKSETFDLVIMDFVMEHLESPFRAAREISRVLKPGGVFVFRTPNFYHYVAIIARLTPQSFHRLMVRKLAENEEADSFVTFYRVNTRRDVKRVLNHAKLEPEVLRMVEKEPHYLTFSSPTFLVGCCYERVVNRFESLAAFRSNIFGCAKKNGKTECRGGRGLSRGL